MFKFSWEGRVASLGCFDSRMSYHAVRGRAGVPCTCPECFERDLQSTHLRTLKITRERVRVEPGDKFSGSKARAVMVNSSIVSPSQKRGLGGGVLEHMNRHLSGQGLPIQWRYCSNSRVDSFCELS